MSSRFTALAAGCAALAMSLPAFASAGTLTTSQRCYTHWPATKSAVKTQPVVVGITGGTPGGRYQVRAGGKRADGSTGSTVGSFNGSGQGLAVLENVFPPHLSINPIKGQTIRLAVHDFSTGTDIAHGRFKITNMAISVADRPSNPYRPRVIRVSGLTPVFGRGKLYGSYVRGYHGKKVVKRIKLGKPNACGYARIKRVLPPRRGYRKWTLYVHRGKRLHRKQSLYWRFRVYRRF